MRNSLGDNDETLWEVRPDGSRMDPWMFTNSLTLVDNEGEVYIYSTGSKGGLNAIGQLCKIYGQEYRQRPGQVPIIELANDFYIHNTYGKTYVPVFEVVGWTDEGAIDVSNATEEPAELPPPPPPVPALARGQRAANPTPRATVAAPASREMMMMSHSISNGKRTPRF